MALTNEDLRAAFENNARALNGWQSRAIEAERCAFRLAEFVREVERSGRDVPYAVAVTARMVVDREIGDLDADPPPVG